MTGRIGGRARSGGSHPPADHEPAASTTSPARCVAPSAVCDPGQASALEQRPAHLGDLDPARRRARTRSTSAAISARGSTADSCGACTPPWPPGARPGSSVAAGARRQPLGLERVRPHQLVAAAQLAGLVAIERHMQGAELEEADVSSPRPRRARARSAATAVRRRAPARAADPRRSSPRRPGRASRRRRSRRRRPDVRARSTSRSSPRSAARHAQARPITPPPTTIASDSLVVLASLAATGRCSSRLPGGWTSHLPAPALPGSGSDGRRPVAALSAHLVRAPVAFQDTPLG